MKTKYHFSIFLIALFAGLMMTTGTAWAQDTERPRANGYQDGYPRAISPTEIEVRWNPGEDNVTAPENLRYRVWYKKVSSTEHFDTGPYLTGITMYTITGLVPNTEYLITVEVRDEANNFSNILDRRVKTLTKSYDIEVGDVKVTSENAANITGPGITGQVSFDPATNTLTLNNATIDIEGRPAISDNNRDGILTIKLQGRNTIIGSTAINILYRSLRISGGGTLTIDAGKVSIYGAEGHRVSIENCTLNANRRMEIHGELQINNSNVYVKDNGVAVYNVSGDFTLMGCQIVHPAGAQIKRVMGITGWSTTVVDASGNVCTEVRISTISTEPSEPEPEQPATLTLEPTELEVEAKGGEHKVTITSTQTIETMDFDRPDWIRCSYPPGGHTSKVVDLTFNPNTGAERKADVVFKTAAGNVTLKVTQRGKDAKPEEPKLTNKALTVTGKTDHSVSLRWNAATCGTLPHAEIAYSIRYRPKNKFMFKWRRSAKLYGKTEHTVTGLEADTEYKFRVLVFRKSMPATNVYTDIAEARTDKLADNTPPAFPEGAQVKVDEVTETTVKISWPKAKDDQTSQNEIRYAIYKNGEYDYHATDIDSRTYTLLTQDTKYNFGVYAIDKAGNWSKRLGTSVTTEKKVVPDTEPPYFPNGQELSVTATETSLNVSWPAAADKGTETPDLSYTFFFSRSDVSYWPGNSLGKNVLSHTVTGLQPDTEYNICVTVYDAAANSADYTWKMKVKTKASNQTVHPASVSIAPASLDLETGNKATLTATVLPANAKDKGVTWSSNLPAIASVDAVTGEVTALAPGKAEITATANDKAGGTKSETVEVRVKAKKVRKLVTDVSVMPAAHTLTEGDIFYYSGIVEPDDADERALTWTSSDPTVATVSKGGGFINALKAGTTTITATANDGSGKYGQSILTVKALEVIVGATGIVVDQTEIQLPKNGTATLTARVLPSNATNKGFTWSSSNPAVASVSSDGVVTAHLPGGTALITATADDGGWTDFCTVRVKGTSVKITPSAFRLGLGESLELTATTEPWDSPMTKSFSSNRFRVAEVDKNGVVKAKAVGDATITVTLSGGQQANCYITVKKGENAPDANELIVDDSNARVWAADGILYVSTEQAADVEVINFSGLLLKKFKAPTGTTPVKYLPAGFYIVRVGQQTTKVVIR